MTNSGASICRLGKTGARTNDLDSAVDQARAYPGITGLGAAWQLAGGQFDGNGHPVGVCKPMKLGELAKVMKRPARMLEAVDKKKLRKGEAKVRTSAKSSGFYPVGSYVSKALDAVRKESEKPGASVSAKQSMARIKEVLGE